MEQYRPGGFKLLPEVVKNLLIINGIFFLATMTMGDKLVDYLGLHYYESEKFQWYQYITYMFMHGGVAHILFNMVALWMFGSPLENLWGPKKFLTYYILTGLGAALVLTFQQHLSITGLVDHENAFLNNPTPAAFGDFVHNNIPLESLSAGYNKAVTTLQSAWTVDPENQAYISPAQQLIDQYIQFKMDIPTVGASGAVFGILLAFGMLFPDTLLFIIPIPFPIKAKYAVILYGLIELTLGTVRIEGDNIAHFAHLGGLLTGFIIMMYWREQNRRRRNDYFS